MHSRECLILRDRFVGGVIGGAIGGALGMPYEGSWMHEIPSTDTLVQQFTYPTEEALGDLSEASHLTLASLRALMAEGELLPGSVAWEMAELWRQQQGVHANSSSGCAQAAARYLQTRDWTSCGAPEGFAGNAAAARTAIFGLYFYRQPEELAAGIADLARITHLDRRSLAGSVALAKAAWLLAQDDVPALNRFLEAIAMEIEGYDPRFADLVRQLEDLVEHPPANVLPIIAAAGMFDRDFAMPTITSFVIPSTLAALWAVCRAPQCWATSVASVIALGGNVDTLASIVGTLQGIRLGIVAVPDGLRQRLPEAAEWQRLGEKFFQCVQKQRRCNNHPPGLRQRKWRDGLRDRLDETYS